MGTTIVSPATSRETMAVFRAWRTGVVFNEDIKYSDPGSSLRGLGMLLVSEMSRRLSRFWEVQCSVLVPSQYGVPNVQNETLNPFVPVIWSPHGELSRLRNRCGPQRNPRRKNFAHGTGLVPVLLAKITAHKHVFERYNTTTA